MSRAGRSLSACALRIRGSRSTRLISVYGGWINDRKNWYWMKNIGSMTAEWGLGRSRVFLVGGNTLQGRENHSYKWCPKSSKTVRIWMKYVALRYRFVELVRECSRWPHWPVMIVSQCAAQAERSGRWHGSGHQPCESIEQNGTAYRIQVQPFWMVFGRMAVRLPCTTWSSPPWWKPFDEAQKKVEPQPKYGLLSVHSISEVHHEGACDPLIEIRRWFEELGHEVSSAVKWGGSTLIHSCEL